MKTQIVGILYCCFIFIFITSGNVLAQDYAAKKTRQKAGFFVEAEAGLGYDSNVFRSPDESYVDFAQTITPTPPPPEPENPTITPDVISSFFVPLSLDAEYIATFSPTIHGIVSYRFHGEFYLESAADNGDEFDNKLRGGLEFLLSQEGKRKNTIYVGPYVGYHREFYVDRDFGVEQTAPTDDPVVRADVSDRYKYVSGGIESKLRKRTGLIQYGANAFYEVRDYEDPVVISQLDQDYYGLGGHVRFRVAKPSKLKLSYDYRVRDFDERPSRGSDGRLLTANPPREYTYHIFGISLRNSITKNITVYLDYELRLREDDYQGYDDYTKNKYGVRFLYDNNQGYRMRLKAAYWERDYDIAKAFDELDQADKEYDGIDIEFRGDYALNKQWYIWVEDIYDLDNSTDKRYEYDRNQIMAGVKWEF